MKKIVICIILISFTLSCVKEERAFDKSPDQRLIEVIDNYYSELASAENGWLFTINTKAGGAYRVWMKFDNNNRVLMLSDMDATWNTTKQTSEEISESSYRIKAMQYPALIFDTYNYIHLMADPQGTDGSYGNINGGVNGSGLISDFEFGIDSLANGTFYLKGRYNSCAAIMDKATPQEEIAVKNGGLKSIHNSLTNYMNNLKYPVIEVNGKKIDINIGGRETSVTYIDDNDELKTFKTSSYMDFSSITSNLPSSNVFFFDPIVFESTSFSNLKIDETGYYLMTSGSKKYVVDNKKPSVPLRFGYNQDYSQMRINSSELSGTLVDPFLTNVYLAAKAGLYSNGKRNMQYANISFQLHPVSGLPVMVFTIRYNNTAGSNYTATWRYQYQTNSDGTITFTSREQSGSSNERGQEPYLRPIVDYFCKLTYSTYSSTSWSNSVISSVTPVAFKTDWVENNTVGLVAPLGGFFPVLEPENICCGKMSK